MEKLEKALNKNFGKNKFTESVYKYVDDNTSVKVLEVDEQKTNAKIEFTTVNKKYLQAISTVAMLGGTKKDDLLSDVIAGLPDKAKKELDELKPTVTTGSCTLTKEDDQVTVQKCKI